MAINTRKTTIKRKKINRNPLIKNTILEHTSRNVRTVIKVDKQKPIKKTDFEQTKHFIGFYLLCSKRFV